MVNQTIGPSDHPKKKKTVQFVGLDDKAVDLAAARGQFLRSVYRFRRREEKEVKRRHREIMAASPTRPQGTAFLCYVYDLMRLENDHNSAANTVTKILDLPELASIKVAAQRDGLLENAETTTQQLPVLLLENADNWSDDIVRTVSYWAATAETKGLYQPTKRTTRVVKSLKQMVSLLDYADVEVVDELLKKESQKGNENESSWDLHNLRQAAIALKQAIKAKNGTVFAVQHHYVDFFTSLEWLDEANTMTCAQLGAVLLGENGLAPCVGGRVSSSSSSESGAVVAEAAALSAESNASESGAVVAEAAALSAESNAAVQEEKETESVESQTSDRSGSTSYGSI